MKATLIYGAGDIRVEDVPDPRLQSASDAIVRITHSCVCGSDLWPYKSREQTEQGDRIGHEFIGVVEETGSDVGRIQKGDLVVAPFFYADGTCEYCRAGLTSACPYGNAWGADTDGGQGEAARVPFADNVLMKLDVPHDSELMPSLLTLSDVFGTGHHAAVSAQVGPGKDVVVVGDGAVGLLGVLAAKRLGAERIVLMGHHKDRTDLGREFGATDVVAERGEAALAAVRELTRGEGAHGVIEAVGTEQSMRTALDIVRDGGAIGYVGVPHGSASGVDLGVMFDRNIALRGGVAPVRTYIPELLPDVLDGTIDPSPVFDLSIGLDEVPAGYRAMDGRTALKVLITP